jgi:hypothetical protein
MQHVSFHALFLTFFTLSSISGECVASEPSANVDRSPAIIGPATDYPVGDQAHLYEGLVTNQYAPVENKAFIDSIQSEDSQEENTSDE